LTYFVIDMHQDAIEVRPVRQMNEHSSFNEVFLTDAVVPHENIVGAAGDGWKVARGTLAHERRFSSRDHVHTRPEASGRVIDEARVEADEYNRTYVWYPQRTGRADLLTQHAALRDRADDPIIRDQVMSTLSMVRTAGWTAARAKAARELGRPPGSEGSIGKLATSEIARRSNDAHSTIAGAHGMLTGGDGPIDAVIEEVIVSTPAQSIAGGTDEIQHNILGENMLGLPKEPSVDRGMPFRDVGRNR